MREVISLSLPERSIYKLRKIANKKDLTLSELLREALRKYLILEEFNAARKKLILRAERRGGPYTDEDIFKIVS